MTERIHDDEVDTSEAVVRRLLAEQRQEWEHHRLTPLRSSGTDNAMWRIHDPDGVDRIVRLPRVQRAVAGLERELDLLPRLADSTLTRSVRVPTLCHAGVASGAFPFPWAVCDWIRGVDMWDCRDDPGIDQRTLGADLAQTVADIGTLDAMPVTARREGDRGGPLVPLLDRLDRWLDDPAWEASTLLDIAAVERSAAESREAASAEDSPHAQAFVHGDLIPGNLLVDDDPDHRRLHAIIDWGGAAIGDPAQDLAPAWSVLDRDGRSAFRNGLDVDDATWLRGRAFELEHAVGGILYYAPRRHPLAEVMQRTLRRILTDE